MHQSNLFASQDVLPAAEAVDVLVSEPGVEIHRIVSNAHASPPGFWYDQDFREWVVVLQGSAGVLFEGESEARVLRPGDYLDIPEHTRHRVEWTDKTMETVWLAVHLR